MNSDGEVSFWLNVVGSNEAVLDFNVTVDQKLEVYISPDIYFPSLNSTMTSITTSNLPNWLSWSSNTLSGTPSEQDSDTDIVFLANDGQNSERKVMTIHVNYKPQLVANSPVTQLQRVNAGSQLTFAVPQWMDRNNDTISIQVVQTDGSPLPSWIVYDSIQQEISVRPPGFEAGYYNLTVIASDQYSSSYWNTTVYVNTAPRVMQLPITIRLNFGEPFRYIIDNGLFVDDEILEYSLSSVAQWVELNSTELVIFGIPTVDDYEVHLLELEASDGMTSSIYNISLIVNRPPVVGTALANQVVTIGEFLIYEVTITTFSDPDGDTFQLYARNLPNWLVFNPRSRVLLGFPGSSNAGDISISLCATDGVGHVCTNQNIHVNRRPYMIHPLPSHQSISVGDEFIYDFSNTFADDDSDQLNITVMCQDGSVLPAWLQYDSDNLVISGSPTTNDYSVDVRIQVKDPFSSILVFDLKIHVNRRPTLVNSIADVIMAPGSSWTYTIMNIFNDVDGDTLTYSMLLNGHSLPNWMDFDPHTHILQDWKI